MSLHRLVGHAPIRAALAAAHARRAVPTSLLFHGPRGVGKQHAALWLARLLHCEAPAAGEPCEECRSCRMALNLEHPDIHWYMPLPRPRGVSGDKLVDALEAARFDRLAEFRQDPLVPSAGDEVKGLYLATVRGMRRRAYHRPSMGALQVFIVGDAEYLVPQEASPEAANALLKLLEEPPDDTHFVLTSSEPGRLLPTIRSRTVPLHFAPLAEVEVRSFLEEHTGQDGATAAWAAGLSQGSIGRALGFLPDGDDRGPLEQERRKAFKLVQAALAEGRAPAFVAALEESPAGARTLVGLFNAVEGWLRDLAAVAAGAEERVLNRDALAALQGVAGGGRLHPADITNALPCLEEARNLVRGNVNPQLVVADTVRTMRRALNPRDASKPRSRP